MNLADLVYYKRKEVKQICAKHGATDVRVFGSVARGDYDEKSDIDILINLESTKKSEGIHYLGVIERLHEELEALFGHKVDVIDESDLRDSIRNDVLKDAILL